MSLQHVLDSTAPNLDEHRSTVLQVLKQLGVSEVKLQNMIEVWNKVLLFNLLGPLFHPLQVMGK
jgi:50S ribosomal subunit-associated GTPase HflX